MRFSTSTGVLLALGSTAFAAKPDATSPLASTLSSSPLFALQSGFAQFQGLLSPETYNLLAGRLAILPARSNSLTSPLQKAFAAAQLAVTDADKATLADAQACLSDIRARGSIPTGYSCVDTDQNTASRYRTAGNTVIEQFAGIVPPSTLTAVQDAWNNYFASLGLIPPANDLNTHMQNALASVVASTSGETVTSMEKMQDCLTASVANQKGLQTNYNCFTTSDGPSQHLQNVFHGILQQFVGYLPPNVVQDIINIYSFYLSSSSIPGHQLMKPMNNAIMSMTASVSGNSVTAVQQMVQCMNDLVMIQGEEQREAYECVLGASGPLMTMQVLVNGIVQQSFGYLPPTMVLALEKQLRPTLSRSPAPSSSSISTAFSRAFHATDSGPEFATCWLALEDCVNASVLQGSQAKCELTQKCKALAQV